MPHSGLTCTTAVHICYGYGIQANIDWKNSLGDEWRQYEQILPALANSSIQQVSLECVHSHVPPQLMALLQGKDVMVGVIDVASDVVETPEEVADTIGMALQFVPREAPDRLHQLRPGADEPRVGGEEARGAGAGRGVGSPTACGGLSRDAQACARQAGAVNGMAVVGVHAAGLGSATRVAARQRKRASAPADKPRDVDALLGAWQRTDGNYIILVRSVGAFGQLDAMYINPRQLPFYQSGGHARGRHAACHLRIARRGLRRIGL